MPEVDPVPWGVAGLIFLIVGLDSISVNFPRPFLPQLCESLGVSRERIGVAVGVLLGCLNGANLLSAFVVGHLSDVYGRRPVLLCGLLGAVAATAHLGFAGSYAAAVVNRLLLGLVDSNTPVAKALLADLSSGPARARLITLFGAVFALSRTFSSALAGLVTLLPAPAPLAARPFALPCLLAAAPLLAVLVFAFFALPPTAARRPPRPGGRGPGRGGAGGLRAGLARMGRSPVLVRLLAVHTLQSFANGGMLLALVLMPTLGSAGGGLGFGPLETGLAYAWNGLVGVVFQAAAFGPLLRRLGLARLYRAGTLLSLLGSLLLPLAPAPLARRPPPHPPGALAGSWAILLLSSALVGVGFMLGLPTLSSMLSFAAEADAQGLAQGTAQSLASAAKALAPPLCGALFSLTAPRGAPWALFVVLAAVYGAGGLLALPLPDRLEHGPPPRPDAAAGEDEEAADAGSAPLLPLPAPSASPPQPP